MVYISSMKTKINNIHKLSIQNLQKSFAEHIVLKNISLSAKSGDVIALLGSSGSGKSTLLRCINLLEQADSGIIQINGITIENKKLKIVSHIKHESGIRIKYIRREPPDSMEGRRVEATLEDAYLLLLNP